VREIKQIPINQLDFNDKTYIFRHTISVDNLKNSIKFEGLLYPIFLLKRNDEKYTIISGYRRASALKELDEENVESIVYKEDEIDKEELLKISIAENTKREDLKPVEIAEALMRIQKELDLSIDELADQFGETFGIGKSTNEIEKYLRLNLLDSETKDIVANNEKAKDVEFELASIDNDDDRQEMINLFKHNADIRKGELHKVIQTAKKLQEEKDKESFKDIFQGESVKNILENDDLKGKDKFKNLLTELTNQVDPELINKQQNFFKYSQEIKSILSKKKPLLANKISFKKKDFSKSELSINLNISNTKELVSIIKVLYESKSNIIEKMLNL